jgi:hypothetical protein
MSRAVPYRSLVTIVALAAGFAVTGAYAAPAAEARAACSKIRQNQTLAASVSWRYTEIGTRVDQGIQRIRRGRDETRVFGRLLIAGATCKRPNGSWIVINPIGLGYDSVGMDALGNVRGSGLMKGWGIGVRGGAGGSRPRIDLQIMHCGKGNFFKTLKAIVGVPIPKVAFTFSAAKWIVGQFLPADKVRCGNVGVMNLVVYATSNGDLRLHDPNTCCYESERITDPNINNPNGGWSWLRQYDVRPVTAKAR